MIHYSIKYTEMPGGETYTLLESFKGEYAHSSHLVQIMRNLDDMALDMVSITVISELEN